MNLYRLDPAPSPWGDYGHILVHGMAALRPADGEILDLDRTGPFVPPISFPGGIMVTEAFRAQLAASGLSGLSFYPVHKRHIVALRWEQWDPAAEAPPEYPASGEPEDFVWERPHDPELAAQLGLIWEVRLQPHAVVRRVQEGEHSWEVAIFVEEASWDGTDLFQAEGVGYRFASERAKQWLDAMVPAWVSFTPVGDGQRVNPALF